MHTLEEIKKIFKENNWYYSKSGILSDYELKKLLDTHKIIKLKAGLFHWIGEVSVDFEDLAHISKIIPQGVFCLYTAMYYHNLTTFVSPSYYISLPKNSRTPTGAGDYPLTIKKWSNQYFDLGVDIKQVGDVIIRMYNLEKTVCDAVRFRKNIGKDTLKEVITSYLQSPQKNYRKLMKYAEVLHVKNILSEYCSMLI